MEDSEPICETEPASFCVELLKRLNTQRGEGYLCDITLVAKEGNEFKAHRNVLSAASPFFAKLLQSEMREKEEGVIRFEEISASIMEAVLGFIYTGNVEMCDEQNAKDLIIAADYLLLVCLKTVGGRFLEKHLTISNCISTFYFAEKYRCENLVARSKKVILENFASVAESDEFLNLEAEEVGSWISNDEICIAAEEDVLEIIERWVKRNEIDRKAKFEKLFGHVRLVFLSRDSFLDVVTHNMVRENHSCLEKVSDAVALVSGAREDALMQSPRRGLGTHTIVACGGKHTVCYLPQRDEWKVLADGLEEQNHNTQMLIFRDHLLAFNAWRTERYDPVCEGWSSFRHLCLYGDFCRVAMVRGSIYATGCCAVSGICTIKRYNVNSWSWESILTSYEGCRTNSCVVASGDCLYVLGGKQQRRDYVTKAERFDTVRNKWEEIADMQQARGCAFGAAMQGKIFVAGGRRSPSRVLRTCEVYSICTNEWQFIGSLNVPRSWGSMVCVNGTLYVVGGLGVRPGPSSGVLSIESYDPTVNEWAQRTSIPVEELPGNKKPSFTGCALKFPKGVLEKLDGFGLKKESECTEENHAECEQPFNQFQ